MGRPTRRGGATWILLDPFSHMQRGILGSLLWILGSLDPWEIGSLDPWILGKLDPWAVRRSLDPCTWHDTNMAPSCLGFWLPLGPVQERTMCQFLRIQVPKDTMVECPWRPTWPGVVSIGRRWVSAVFTDRQ